MHTYPLPAGETSFLFALNLDPSGTSFWTAGFESGNVYDIDIASGTILHQFNAWIVGIGSGPQSFIRYPGAVFELLPACSPRRAAIKCRDGSMTRSKIIATRPAS